MFLTICCRDGGYSTCELTVVGKAFLWHQIRCVVAVLLLVGQGREEPTVSNIICPCSFDIIRIAAML